MKITVFAHSQSKNKLVNEAGNISARVSGQDRKISPVLGTNQIAGFGEDSARLQAWKKVKRVNCLCFLVIKHYFKKVGFAMQEKYFILIFLF